MNTYDCSLIIVPPILVNGPIPGPAMLKAYAKQHGYDIKIINPSVEVFKACSKDIQEKWPYEQPDAGDVNKWVDEALSYNPKFIGLSLFAWSGEYFLKQIIARIREISDLPIILGGPGTTEVHGKVDVDYYVVGDGEKAMLEFLRGNFSDHKMNILSNDEWADQAPADYSDETEENMEFYRNHKRYVMYATGSKGCVYDCSFCNVPAMMKYRFKDGVKFAHEIKDIQRKYNPKTIELSDSLINGSLEMWRDLITELAILNMREPETTPKIVAHYRVRSPKAAPEWEFEMAKAAGFYRWKMGIESGSDDVRKHIGKKETDEDILYTMKMLDKYDMKMTWLMIVGYPTETSNDFEKSMQILEEVKESKLDHVVEKFVINELYISEGTGLMDMVDSLGIQDVGSNADEKLSRPWIRTLPNGEVLDGEVRHKRCQYMKQWVIDNYKDTENVIMFTAQDTSVFTR